MKKIMIIMIAGLLAMGAASATKPDAAAAECMKTAALDGRKAMQKCKSMKSPRREDCEKKTQASLAGAEKACRGGH